MDFVRVYEPSPVELEKVIGNILSANPDAGTKDIRLTILKQNRSWKLTERHVLKAVSNKATKASNSTRKVVDVVRVYEPTLKELNKSIESILNEDPAADAHQVRAKILKQNRTWKLSEKKVALTMKLQRKKEENSLQSSIKGKIVLSTTSNKFAVETPQKNLSVQPVFVLGTTSDDDNDDDTAEAPTVETSFDSEYTEANETTYNDSEFVETQAIRGKIEEKQAEPEPINVGKTELEHIGTEQTDSELVETRKSQSELVDAKKCQPRLVANESEPELIDAQEYQLELVGAKITEPEVDEAAEGPNKKFILALEQSWMIVGGMCVVAGIASISLRRCRRS